MKQNIEDYLHSICLLIIDEFNISYKNYENKDLKSIADIKFNEMDIAARIGYYFPQMAHYTISDGGKKGVKINHDLFIESKGFKIEIKTPKNWKTPYGTRTASKNWSVYQNDFDWLFSEIDKGNKGKVAFLIAWFNCVDSLAQMIQLGASSGSHPLVNEERIQYFPFLHRPTIPTHTADLRYDYDSAANVEFKLNLIGRQGIYNCKFYGSKEDCFHIACYY